MKDIDPTAPLWDFIVRDGRLAWRVEESELTCTCESGWLDAAWVFQREPQCTCKFKDTNFEHMHEVFCDAVPCPFCPLEAL